MNIRTKICGLHWIILIVLQQACSSTIDDRLVDRSCDVAGGDCGVLMSTEQPVSRDNSRSPGVFISYRRGLDAGWAPWLYDKLSDRFDPNRIFMDLDSIAAGDDFVEVITQSVASCRVLIALIGKGWAGALDTEGRRRLDDPGDFVRLEIESALEHGIRVIPLLIEGATMPPAAELPATLAPIASRQALTLTATHRRYDVEHLVEAVERALEQPTVEPVVVRTQAREGRTQAREGLTSPAAKPPTPPVVVVVSDHAKQSPRRVGEAAIGRAALPPPAASPRDRARRRWRAYRWPLIGGVVAVVLAVTTATAWPRGDGETSGPNSVNEPPPQVSLLWHVSTGHPANGAVAVAPEHIVVAGDDGVLRGLRRTDGRQAWTFKAGAGVAVATRTPNGVAYATTGSGALIAVNTATGKPLWRRETGAKFDTRPFVARSRVYAGGRDTVLYAYELSGSHHRWRVWTGGAIRQPPVVAGDIAVVASSDGRLYGVDHTGRRLWRPTMGEVVDDPAEAGDAVCVAVADGSILCVRAADGERLSRITVPGGALTALVGGDGVIYAAAADRTVGAWDTHTGNLRWRYRPAGATPTAGQLGLHDGQIQAAYADGKLAGIDAATGAERWRYAINDTFDDAPKGDDGALFIVGTTGIAYALKVPSSPTSTAATPPPAPSESAPATSEHTVTTATPRTPPRTHTTTSNTPSPSTTASPEPTTATTTPPPGTGG
jgi:outer membrane protein assembly factor BamB